MIEVEIHTIRVSLNGPHRAILLREVGQERQLPIFIHQNEAEAILMELQGQKRPRPLTHDLLKNSIAALGGELQYVLVNDLRTEPGMGGTFYAVLHVRQDGREIDIDARPSDSIALAVRAQVPIFVTEAVLEEAGIYPAEDTERVKEQLSVFSDFVDSLDLGDAEK